MRIFLSLLLAFFLTTFSPQPSYAATFNGKTDCTTQAFSCYMNKYGFGSASGYSFSKGQLARIAAIKPYAIAATAAFNSVSGHDKVEPQMLVEWPILDTGGIINYSNCGNESPPKGLNYNNYLANCNRPDFWQLGYGIQFANIGGSGLSQAFRLYGDPNNAALVQQVGQKVLNFDRNIPTSPTCGGYSCTFPKLTISQIMAGINLNRGAVTQNNWWASVLSRDPYINNYIDAFGLQVSRTNIQKVKAWDSTYYYNAMNGGKWAQELAQIVKTWDQIPNTGETNFGVSVKPTPTPTKTPTHAPFTSATDTCQGFAPNDPTHTAQEGSCVYMTTDGPVAVYDGYLFYGACIDKHAVAGSLISCDQDGGLEFPNGEDTCTENFGAGYHSIQDSIRSCKFNAGAAYLCCAKDNQDKAIAPPTPCLTGSDGKCHQVSTALGILQVDPGNLVGNLFGIFLGLAGGIAIVLIIISGYQIMFARADPEKLTAARERLTSAIIGLLFIIFSIVLVRIIGIDILHIPGF